MKLILEGVIDTLKESAEIKNESQEPAGPFIKPFADLEKVFNSAEKDAKKAQTEIANRVAKALGKKFTKIQDWGDTLKFGFDIKGRPIVTANFSVYFEIFEDADAFHKALQTLEIKPYFANPKGGSSAVVSFEFKKTL